MATDRKPLHILAAIPDPTLPPGLLFASGTNRPYLTFDGTTAIEKCVWVFEMPSNYASGPKLRVHWSGSSSTTTSHTAQWSGFIMASTPDVDGAMDSDSYDSENVVSDDILGTTAKRHQLAEITLTNADSVDAGDYVALQLQRDYSDAADDLEEDAWLWLAALEYTTT